MDRRIIFIVLAVVCLISLSGCSGPADNKADGSLSYGGIERTYIVHAPASYNGTDPVPLVVVLHGINGNALDAERTSGMSGEADKKGFIVVYPNATGKDGRYTWNTLLDPAGGADDVGFLRAVVQKMEAVYNIDKDRIYVAGFSDGAIMTYAAASQLSDVFSAAAPVAGTSGGYLGNSTIPIDYPAPANPVAIIAFHGTNDTVVPYYGGAPYTGKQNTYVTLLSANESVRLWASYDGCNLTPDVTYKKNYTLTSYGGGKNGTEVVLYAVNGLGHGWPGVIKPDNGTSVSPRATDLIWGFFSAHPRRD